MFNNMFKTLGLLGGLNGNSAGNFNFPWYNPPSKTKEQIQLNTAATGVESLLISKTKLFVFYSIL